MERPFVEFSVNKLIQLTARIEDCLSRLDEEQIWRRASPAENAVGNLVLHLTGNVSQWILKSVGNRTYERNRDAEFAAQGGVGRDVLLDGLRRTIKEATEVIGGLDRARLEGRVKVQNYEVTVCEAVYHVVEHFSQHTGQIILLTKLYTSTDLGYYKHLNSAHRETTP